MLRSCFRWAGAAALSCMLMTAGAVSAQDRTGWPNSVNIGTASQGGTYFIYGAGWGGLIQEMLGVNASAEVTGGPTQNMVLVHQGRLEFGMTTMGPAREGWDGELEVARGLQTRDVRALFPMYQTPLQVVALKRSGINSIADLDGKRVGVGPRGGTASVFWPRFFSDLGLNVRVRYGGAADQVGQVQDGMLDAFAFAAGVPISAFSQIEAQQPVNIFSLNEEEIAKITQAHPVSRFVIPANTYRTVAEEQPTVALWNFAIANKNMPESFVYEIMKAVLDNNDRMVTIHRSAEETLAENMVHNTFMWFHPGAVRYYKERGIEVPEHLIPPEYKD
ncbi:C4-dicarboxylate ABC transporter substrate-binding protein [Ectothiorhodospira shaposhnikovii]|uniref:TAXI family TRAP transporter solute-binding subunit n=1 Tax=Ectothiorhodospira shaposhnikovii TaxID=1054 RepID=UPI001906E462|nr:TAXI family TRAP transporter solute-binding subunit [Ectothiorhodospira shaposhnikovii]MBK1671780.1 C4-dicarboxylate ABC transporter substrate-binding protein [Ectothiorhodospira shaposhnikovii]